MTATSSAFACISDRAVQLERSHTPFSVLAGLYPRCRRFIVRRRLEMVSKLSVMSVASFRSGPSPNLDKASTRAPKFNASQVSATSGKTISA